MTDPSSASAFDPDTTNSFDAVTASEEIVGALRPLADPDRAVQEKRYLKSELDFLGIRLPDIRNAVTEAARKRPALDRAAIIDWARTLWQGTLFERRMAAAELLRAYVRSLAPADLPAIAGLIREAAGWALVDSLAGDTVGRIVLAHPEGWPHIDGWARDEDFWIRRAALLTLLCGIGAGTPDLERFDRYASSMLSEKEFFIRKAIGWVLREIAKKDPAYTAAWTGRHLDGMSGVTFREAVRRLPEADAARLRARYAAR